MYKAACTSGELPSLSVCESPDRKKRLIPDAVEASRKNIFSPTRDPWNHPMYHQ